MKTAHKKIAVTERKTTDKDWKPDIKLLYTWKRNKDGQIWQEIVPVGCLEGKGDKPFILCDNSLYTLVSREIYKESFVSGKGTKFMGNKIKSNIGTNIFVGYNKTKRHYLILIENKKRDYKEELLLVPSIIKLLYSKVFANIVFEVQHRRKPFPFIKNESNKKV